MFWVVLLSCATVTLTFAVGVLSLSFSRAPGWRCYRTFSGICGLICVYAFLNALFLECGDGGLASDIAGRASAAVGLGMAALWLLFSRQHTGQKANRLDLVLVSAVVLTIPLMFWPGLLIDGVKVTEVPDFGLRYYTPAATLLGEAAYSLAFVTNGVVLVRYAMRARREGTRRAWSQFGGFAFFLTFAFEEVLVSVGFLKLPYLGQLGFLGLMVTVGIDMMSRIADDAQQLAILNAELEARVSAAYDDVMEAQQALLSAQRHATLGHVASGVGHEINDPLSFLGGNLSFLQERLADVEGYADEREALEEAIIGVSRIAKVVQDLTVFEDTESSGDAQVVRAIETAIEAMSPSRRDRIRFEIEADKGIVAAVPEARLVQLLGHLFVNASHATEAQQAVAITVGSTTENGSVVLRVSDTGCGMNDTSGVFDPFYTTRDVGEGTGMGLFVSREIATMAGGSIEIDSVVDQGTTVTLRIPQSTARAPSKAALPIEPAEVSLSGTRIFAIDDEEQVLRAMRRILRSSAAEFVGQSDSRRALEHLEGDVHYDVILCDLMMPDLSGAALYRELTATKPELAARFLFVTGGAVTPATEAFLREPGIRHIGKPIERKKLNIALQRILAAQDDRA